MPMPDMSTPFHTPRSAATVATPDVIHIIVCTVILYHVQVLLRSLHYDGDEMMMTTVMLIYDEYFTIAEHDL